MRIRDELPPNDKIGRQVWVLGSVQLIHDQSFEGPEARLAHLRGDPHKVVISGQSFGAGSVAAQYTSPLSKGLFRGAMMTSACNFGGTGMIGGVVPLAEGEKAGLELQQRLGAENLAAMRNVPADRILALQEESQLGLSIRGVRAPSVVDGYFWSGTKEQAFASHQASDVPVIASSNGDDLDSARYPLTRASTVVDYQAMARQIYGAAADQFLQLFPAQTDADVAAAAGRFLQRIASATIFRCATTSPNL